MANRQACHLFAVDLRIVGQMLDAQDDVAAEPDVVRGERHGGQGSRFPRYDEEENAAGVHCCCFDRDEPPTPAARLGVEERQAALPETQSFKSAGQFKFNQLLNLITSAEEWLSVLSRQSSRTTPPSTRPALLRPSLPARNCHSEQLLSADLLMHVKISKRADRRVRRG